MVRVLHIVGTMDMGGAETLIMNLYRTVDREKIQFDFLCHNRIEAKYTDEIKAMGGRMYMVPGISHVGLFRYQNNLYDFFRAHPEYKTVHAHQNDLNGLILKQAARAGIPNRISHSHTVYPYKSLLKKMMFQYFKWNVNRYTTVPLACSIPAGEQLYTGKRKKEFSVVYNGIDTEKFRFDAAIRQQVRKELSIGQNAPVVGHVGRFAPVKNHTFIIDVFYEFQKTNPEAVLMLIGEGELLEKIKAKTKTLGIEQKVLFLGARGDVNRLMCAMDMFLFPSINEGLPVSVVEAQGSGLQILSTDSISDDTAITDLFHRISLDLSAFQWAEHLNSLYQKSLKTDRQMYAKAVLDAGFDAKQVADNMLKKYR